MAKSTRTMYFAVKLVAANFGKQKAQSVSVPATTVTIHNLETPKMGDSGGANYLRVGGKPGTSFPGIAGHFTAQILDFSDKEDSKCKTVAEAEQLVRKTHKDWLADAYDWYVVPAETGGSSQGAKTSKSSAKSASKKSGKK